MPSSATTMNAPASPFTVSRISTGIAGLDLVLGGGLTHGSLTLLTGQVGVGKSTLALQVMDAVRMWGIPALYLSELTPFQVSCVAKRLKISSKFVAAEILDSDDMFETIETVLGGVIVVDGLIAIAPNPKTAAKILSTLKRLTVEKGCTIIVTAMLTKGKNLDGLFRYADTVVEMGNFNNRMGCWLDTTRKNKYASQQDSATVVRLKMDSKRRFS